MIGSVKKLAILLSRDQLRQDFTAFYFRFANFLIIAILKLWTWPTHLWKAGDKFNHIKSIKIKIYPQNPFYRGSNMQCCKNEAILKLKRDFCPYFSAKIFKRTRQTLLIPKIYILDYIKKYMGPFRFFGTQKKTPANLRIFQNLRFLSGHYSKPPFSRIFFWHLFTQLFPYFGIKTLLVQRKGIKTWKLAFKIHPKTSRFSEKGVLRHDFLPFYA